MGVESFQSRKASLRDTIRRPFQPDLSACRIASGYIKFEGECLTGDDTHDDGSKAGLHCGQNR